LPLIERTAYPRFSPVITASELQQSFTPTDAEQEFAQANTPTGLHAFCLLALLKCFQPPSSWIIYAHTGHFARMYRWHTRTNGISIATAPRFETTWASKLSTGNRPAIWQCRQSTELPR